MDLSVLLTIGIKFVGVAGAIWLRRKNHDALNVIGVYLLVSLVSIVSGDKPGDDPFWFLRCAFREALTITGLLWFCGNFKMRNWLIYVLLGCLAVNVVAYFDFVLKYYQVLPYYQIAIQSAAILELLILINARAYVTEQELAERRRRAHERLFRRRFVKTSETLL